MIYVLTTFHVICCLFLIIVVLLQSGKAADLAGAFGGMGSQTAFGPRGAATVLTRATTIAAGVFMLTSLSLSVMASRTGGSGGTTVLERSSSVTPAKKDQKSEQKSDQKAPPIQVSVPGGGTTSAPAPVQSAPAPPAAPAKK